MPRLRRERIEAAWVATVVVLLAGVLAAATPGAFAVGNGITGSGSDPPTTEFIALSGQQYYWTADESGLINGTFDNVLVVYANEWVQVNLSASGATQSLLIPFRDQAIVDVQAVPGSASYATFQAPSVPGVYGVPDGEYDGPWFGQDVSALVVLPPIGNALPSLSAFQSNGGGGDIYNPPVLSAVGTGLLANGEGLFNNSVPGPTLTNAAASGTLPIDFDWQVPLSSIGINNYLVNVTSANSNAQQQYVIDHNYTLPYQFGIYRITPATGLSVVSSEPLVVGRTVTEAATLPSGVYLYGLVTPVAYSYDPSGESGVGTGIQTGFVMGLWGVIWLGT